MSSFTAEITQLERLIKQSTEQRVALLQQINRTRSACFVLPTELLSEIFKYACLESPGASAFVESRPNAIEPWEQCSWEQSEARHVQFTLGAVCARWRQVAWSAPTLWTSISLKITPGSYSARLTIAVLQLFMDNSGALPVSLELDFVPFSEPESLTGLKTSLNPVKEAIFRRHAWKIKALRLNYPPDRWLPQKVSDMPRLEDFSIASVAPWEDEELAEMSFEDVTTLRRLSIYWDGDSVGHDLHFYWPSITVLHLDHLPIMTCIELLGNCPNLISFNCFSYTWSYDGGKEGITSFKLEDLSWGFPKNCSGSLTTILLKLHFPSLKNLHLFKVCPDVHSALLKFLHNFSSTLTTLEFGGMYHSHHDARFFEVALEILGGVTELALSCSCTCVLCAICSVLAPPMDESNDGGICIGAVRLPDLQVLRCHDIRPRRRTRFSKEVSCKSPEEGLEAVEQMLEARKRQGWGVPLRFEMSRSPCDCEIY